MATLKEKLMLKVISMEDIASAKVTIVGVGLVGMACAFSLLTQGIANEIALIDLDADKLKGELMDLQHGLAFIHNVKLHANTDYSVSYGSKLCIVTAGARQRPDESRLDLVQRNVEIFKGIIPNLVKFCPDAILLVVSNPVDIMTYVTWKLSGFPEYRVIGSGTNLDSSRFRFLLSERLGISPTSCNGWIIGEHGDSSVPVWGSAYVAGVRLTDLNPKLGDEDDPENWASIHKQVVGSAYEIIKLKGYTSWAIGLSCAALCRSILYNQRDIFAVSVHAKGQYGIEHEVFFSLPCVLGQNGVTDVVNQPLTKDEFSKLKNSAEVLFKIQRDLTF